MNLLFVCSRNKWRSPTGEAVWRRQPGISARSAGTSPKARRRVSERDIAWADIIFVMENKHRSRLRVDFPEALSEKSLHVLDIPDEYDFMDEELVDLLHESVAPYLD